MTDFANQLFKRDYAQEAKELLMVNRPKPQNTIKWKQFDTSHITPNDVVAIIDGDWLAFTATSMEMERAVAFEYNGKRHVFKGLYTEMKEFCKQHNIPYEPSLGVKVQKNHPSAVNFAKSSIKKKVRHIIEATGATKVVMICGSTGNVRSRLPLPKLSNDRIWSYKGQREDGWIPKTLTEVKTWLMSSWESHWAVGEEADDCITVTSQELCNKGVKAYIVGIDKDYCCEQFGGLYLIGRHETPVYLDKNEGNALGWVQAYKSEGGSEKMLGQGDRFLCYQILHFDEPDNYWCAKTLRVLGTGGNFSFKQCEKYLMSCNTRKELWEKVLKRFTDNLPEKFTYEDCFGVWRESTPLDMLRLFYSAAKMREYADHTPCVIEDRLKPLGVTYDYRPD